METINVVAAIIIKMVKFLLRRGAMENSKTDGNFQAEKLKRVRLPKRR